MIMKRNDNQGFALVSIAILLGIVMAFGFILIDYVFSSRVAGRQLQEGLTAIEIAEAGVQKAIFCLNATSGSNCSGSYGTNHAGETGVSFGGGTFTTVLTGSGATRTITSTGTTAANRRAVVRVEATTVPATDSPGFSYALQSGAGGAHMENNATISGTIYSNGDIDCKSTNATITGDAYSAKTGGQIYKCKVVYDAHADKILSSSVQRDAYYKNDPADISGTTVTRTKYPNSATPVSTILPAIDLDFWRNSAAAGGTIAGNYYPTDNSTLGPVKITGDLIMDNNVDITVGGPIWVMGNISAGNNVSFTLASSFGTYSTVILADDPADNANHGKIAVTNNTGIYGSGDPKSHILFASTNSSSSDVSPALSVSNNASGAVFYAMNGTLRLANNAGAKSLAGYRLYLDENSAVTYVESDFTGDFSNSPAGTWHIADGSWREVKQ